MGTELHPYQMEPFSIVPDYIICMYIHLSRYNLGVLTYKADLLITEQFWNFGTLKDGGLFLHLTIALATETSSTQIFYQTDDQDIIEIAKRTSKILIEKKVSAFMAKYGCALVKATVSFR